MPRDSSLVNNIQLGGQTRDAACNRSFYLLLCCTFGILVALVGLFSGYLLTGHALAYIVLALVFCERERQQLSSETLYCCSASLLKAPSQSASLAHSASGLSSCQCHASQIVQRHDIKHRRFLCGESSACSSPVRLALPNDSSPDHNSHHCRYDLMNILVTVLAPCLEKILTGFFAMTRRHQSLLRHNFCIYGLLGYNIFASCCAKFCKVGGREFSFFPCLISLCEGFRNLFLLPLSITSTGLNQGETADATR